VFRGVAPVTSAPKASAHIGAPSEAAILPSPLWHNGRFT
jgi:hypothetical protein